MARALSCSLLALLFIASAAPSYGQKEVSVAPGAALVVECGLRPEQRVEWQRDGREVPQDMTRSEVPAPGGGVTARLQVERAGAHHAGVYTCALGEPATRVRVRIQAPATTESVVTAAAGAGEAEGEGEPYPYEVRYMNFSIDCSSLYSPGEKIEWTKNGSSLDSWADVRGRFVSVEGFLKLAPGERAWEADWGLYKCSSSKGERAFRAYGVPYAKLPTDTSVVEGQKLKLTCKVQGRPYPPVVWLYSSVSEEMENATNVTEALEGRATLRDLDKGNGVKLINGELVVDPAERSDAGWYSCAPQGAHSAKQISVTQLRVKDKYAALWPFLGICAEVFVLCAVILIYERRRTKPEIDDSDTDNNDQAVPETPPRSPSPPLSPVPPPHPVSPLPSPPHVDSGNKSPPPPADGLPTINGRK